MISDSELSDDFSLDTVGSYGDVKCKGRYKDYLVSFELHLLLDVGNRGRSRGEACLQ